LPAKNDLPLPKCNATQLMSNKPAF